MGTGPGAETGFDIVLTEVLDKKGHYFVAAAGSERGPRCSPKRAQSRRRRPR